MLVHLQHSFFFFFNDTATTEIYTLSLHDALPISARVLRTASICFWTCFDRSAIRSSVISSSLKMTSSRIVDRKSTRLNSSHLVISYAVFCLKKKSAAVASAGDESSCAGADLLARA